MNPVESAPFRERAEVSKGRVKGIGNMKSVFTLNTHIEAMLDTAKYDIDKLINAVQASLNSAVGTEGDAKRGAVKLVGGTVNGTKVKGAGFKFNESLPIAYVGKTDAPARFAQWHDAIARLFKVTGDPSGELTTAILPASLKSWLDEKFSLTPAAPAEVPARRKDNARGNGDVKPNVQVPAAPAA
jgi:hypothetical protein